MFGGAFDPPHSSHLEMARCAVRQLALDELRVIPTGQAWHKDHVLSPAVHRIAMSHLAFDGESRLVVDPRETLRPGPSYTVDTLQELQTQNPGAQLYLLLGGDQARDLPTWKRWQELLPIAIFCIASRGVKIADNGPTGANTSESQESLESTWSHIADAGGRCVQLNLPPDAVSSTHIRQWVAQNPDFGQAPGTMVKPSVASYIAQHHLYLEPR